MKPPPLSIQTHDGHRSAVSDSLDCNTIELTVTAGENYVDRNRDEKDGLAVIVCVVGKTTLLYDHRCLADLHAMLKKHGDWMELGSADEQKPVKAGTVEAWGRSEQNPVGGWCRFC